MDIIGIMIMLVGLILMVAAKGVYRSGLKSARKLTDSAEEREAYMMLVGSGMTALRIVGFVLMLLGIPVFIFGIM